MNIQEMHIMFRQYAQQMGLQNVRAILPEQIDLLINNSISDNINQVITQNIGLTNDRVITDNSKLNQINTLKTLYKVWKGKVTLGNKKTNYIVSYQLDLNKFKVITKISYIIDGETFTDDTITGLVDGKEVTYTINDVIYTSADIQNFSFDDGTQVTLKFVTIAYLYIVDLNIDYKNETFITNIFPIRIIDDAYLADVVNDFILSPKLRSPVASIHDNLIELYIDKPDKNSNPDTFKGLSVNELRLSYISKPAIVKFADDVGGGSVDCDLPEYMHVDIVKHAVELYRIALTGSIAVTQAAQQQQQRENLRNNYRQDNNDNSQQAS